MPLNLPPEAVKAEQRYRAAKGVGFSLGMRPSAIQQARQKRIEWLTVEPLPLSYRYDT